MYEVLISHEAEKQDKDSKRRLNKCIDNLRREPLFGQHIKKLHGELEGKHRFGLRYETQQIIKYHKRLVLGFTYVQSNLQN